MTNLLRSTCVAVLVGGLFPAAASAQTNIEVAVGYNVVDYRGQEATPAGWYLSVAAKPVPWFAVVSELTTEFNTDERPPVPIKHRAFVFLDGPRFIWSEPLGLKRASVFGEVLAGLAHDRDFFSERSGANHFVWQPGAGVDLELSERIAARFLIGARVDSSSKISSPTGVRFVSALVVAAKTAPPESVQLRTASPEVKKGGTTRVTAKLSRARGKVSGNTRVEFSVASDSTGSSFGRFRNVRRSNKSEEATAEFEPGEGAPSGPATISVRVPATDLVTTAKIDVTP